jgi:hypothetical protein
MLFHSLPLAAALLSPALQDADLILVDSVEVIVNDEILTYRQVMSAAARRVREGAQPTAQQLARLRNSVARDLIEERLQVQGGIDMGFKPQTVELMVTDNMERRVDAAGGVIQMADKLQQGNLSLNEQKTKMRRDLYRYSWDRAITGVSAGVSGRTYRDRYVRPGKLLLHHQLLKKGRLGAEAIGGQSARYSLQELLFPISSADNAEQVRVRAENIYRQIVEGDDFTETIRAQSTPTAGGAPASDGMLPTLTGLDLARNGGPEIAAFALSAAEGELSTPLPVVREGKILGWRIVKLIKTEKPILPVFSLPKTQAAIRKAIQQEADEARRSSGIKALSDGAFVWIAAEDQNT